MTNRAEAPLLAQAEDVAGPAATTSRVLRLLRPHRGKGALLVFLGVLASLSEGVGIGLFIPFFEALDSGRGSTGGETRLGDFMSGFFAGIPVESRLLAIGFAIFGAVVFKAVLTYATSVLTSTLSEKIGHELRTRIFEEVLTVDFAVLGAMGQGRILNALANESWKAAGAVIQFLQAVITTCTLGIYVALLLLISWKMTLVVAVVLVLMAAAIRFLTRRVGSFGSEITRVNAEMAGKIVDGVEGIEVIRGYGHEDYERKRFDEVSERLARVTARLGILSGSVYPIYEVIAAAVLVTVLITSLQTPASLAPLLVFVFLLYRLVPVIKRLEKERVDLIASGAAVIETLAIIQAVDRSYLLPGHHSFSGIESHITLDNVSYRYEAESTLALRNISARIPSTGLTAIVGPSGSGKSTLVKLLLRFFDPTEGRILVDGMLLSDLRIEDWRRRLAVVPQKVFLFNASVRENIAYGNRDAGEEAIVTAARMAGADDFIQALPNKYETLLGTSGIELSGGEGQRICLARALVREPDFLLLDEATNALDSISEELILSALKQLKERCAVVVIAHRLTTIESADQILVLDDGELVEQGDLETLLAEDGLFARLYKLQRFERDRHGHAEFI